MTNDADDKGKRVTIDLSPAAAEEVERLKKLTNMTTANIFRTALTMFRLYVKAKQEGNQFLIADPSQSGKQTMLEFPIDLQLQGDRQKS